MAVEFTVGGHPVAQGSMIAVVSRTTGKAFVKPSNEKALKKWRDEVARVARLYWKGPPADEPLQIRVNFYRGRPKSWKASTHDFDPTGQDVDKMLRAIFDALTGVVVVNDSRFVGVQTFKYVTEGEERAEIKIIGVERSVGVKRDTDEKTSSLF